MVVVVSKAKVATAEGRGFGIAEREGVVMAREARMATAKGAGF